MVVKKLVLKRILLVALGLNHKCKLSVILFTDGIYRLHLQSVKNPDNILITALGQLNLQQFLRNFALKEELGIFTV